MTAVSDRPQALGFDQLLWALGRLRLMLLVLDFWPGDNVVNFDIIIAATKRDVELRLPEGEQGNSRLAEQYRTDALISEFVGALRAPRFVVQTYITGRRIVVQVPQPELTITLSMHGSWEFTLAYVLPPPPTEVVIALTALAGQLLYGEELADLDAGFQLLISEAGLSYDGAVQVFAASVTTKVLQEMLDQ